MVLAAAALLAADPGPDDAQIVRALDGNICRCCAYPRILRAVRAAAGTAGPPGAARPHEQEQAQEAERLPPDATTGSAAGPPAAAPVEAAPPARAPGPPRAPA